MHGSPPEDGLGRRLRALADHHVPDATRQQHLAAIDAELARHHTGAPADASRDPGRLWRRRTRRWVAGVAAATALFVPAGAAVAASQGALPGHALYPVKQLTEPVRGVFDTDVAARHRLDELEALRARGASPESLQSAADAAQRAVAGLPDDHWLHERLAGLLALPASPPTPSNGPAPVPAPTRATPSPPGDPDTTVDDDAGDDADPAEPHDADEPRESADEDVDAELSDDADGEEDDAGHDLEVPDETDDRGPDHDDAEADDDIEEPDGGDGTDEVIDDAPEDDDRTGDDEADEDDHDS